MDLFYVHNVLNGKNLMTIIKVDSVLDIFIFFNFFLDFFFFQLSEFFCSLSYRSFGGDILNLESLLLYNPSLIFSLKFLFVIFFLILIRGGIPRYRYDYLTKLG